MIRQCFAIAFIVLLCLPGCGRKTPPLPPQAVIPLPITDLQQKIDEQGAFLIWTSPSFSASASSEASVRTFLVLQSEVSPEDCVDCPVHYNQSFSVDAADLIPGKKIVFRIPSLKIHHSYHFKVLSRSGWGVSSEDSNEVAFLWESPPLAPAGLAVMVGDQQLTLTWQPVSRFADGRMLSIPALYQVFRSENGENFIPIGSPQAAETYSDTGLTNGRAHHYQVRAFHSLSGADMFSPASETVVESPMDKTPPAPPYKITVVEIPTGVKVLWEDIGDSDVAGYRIYRRLEGEEYILAGETGSNAFTFTDLNVPAGKKTFYYRMTAFDHAEPPNESVFSQDIEFRQ